MSWIEEDRAFNAAGSAQGVFSGPCSMRASKGSGAIPTSSSAQRDTVKIGPDDGWNATGATNHYGKGKSEPTEAVLSKPSTIKEPSRHQDAWRTGDTLDTWDKATTIRSTQSTRKEPNNLYNTTQAVLPRSSNSSGDAWRSCNAQQACGKPAMATDNLVDRTHTTVGTKREREEQKEPTGEKKKRGHSKKQRLLSAARKLLAGMVTAEHTQVGVSPTLTDKNPARTLINSEAMKLLERSDAIVKQELARASKKYEAEKTAWMAVESKLNTDAIDAAKRLNEEIEKRAAAEGKRAAAEVNVIKLSAAVDECVLSAGRVSVMAESRLNDEVEKRIAAEDREKLALDRCAALEKRIAFDSKANSDAVDAAKMLTDEVEKRIGAEDREKIALERCAALEKRIVALESEKRTRDLSKNVVVKQEIMYE